MRYRITVGLPGDPGRTWDRVAARPRSREKALERAEALQAQVRSHECIWVWEEKRPRSWTCIGSFGPRARVSEFPYVWFWHRMGRKGQPCRVVCRGKMNSALLEFEDGFRTVTSRSGLRRR